MKRLGILSLGCPRNLVDSENILGRLKAKGFRAGGIKGADTVLVNTCSFIEEAKRESIDAILDLAQLKREGKLKRIIVYGCLAQRYGAALAKGLPEVDAFVGRVSLNHAPQRYALTPAYYRYLKICEGCLSACSFCAIPRIKGKFASLPFPAVLRLAGQMRRQKTREINIIGQDITGYGRDLYGRFRLAELVRRISRKMDYPCWIRLLYLYPSRVDDDLLRAVRDCPNVCKYIDLPLQHINSRILKLMRRQTDKAQVMQLIARIRKFLPQAALRTSLIVGFPSETEQEFRQLLDFAREVKFERLGAFTYSREEGTPAYNLAGQVAQKVKLERFGRLMSLQRDISVEVNRGFLGRVMEVLIEEGKGGQFTGRSQYDAPEVDGVVYVHSRRPLRPGEFARVKITDTLEYDLCGEVLA
jgi:ribosomal protein S12 methylthiotransferase